MMLELGSSAIKNAMTATTTTAILPTSRELFSEASFLITPLYISSETAEAVTSSWLSAVDMIAARIPQRKMPPMKISTPLLEKISWIRRMKAVSLLPASSCWLR